MAFGDIALAQLKASVSPQAPRNYQIWYTYTTGYRPSINQTINELLQKKGSLSEADLQSIPRDLSLAVPTACRTRSSR